MFHFFKLLFSNTIFCGFEKYRYFQTLTFRVEKEKMQLKSEIDDLHAQIDHVSKNRVSIEILFPLIN